MKIPKNTRRSIAKQLFIRDLAIREIHNKLNVIDRHVDVGLTRVGTTRSSFIDTLVDIVCRRICVDTVGVLLGGVPMLLIDHDISTDIGFTDDDIVVSFTVSNFSELINTDFAKVFKLKLLYDMGDTSRCSIEYTHCKTACKTPIRADYLISDNQSSELIDEITSIYTGKLVKSVDVADNTIERIVETKTQNRTAELMNEIDTLSKQIEKLKLDLASVRNGVIESVIGELNKLKQG